MLVNEVGATSGAGRPGFAGWFLGVPGGAPEPFKTDKGITIGSTMAQMAAAYGPSLTTSHGEQGQAFFISTPSGLQITGQLSNIPNDVPSLTLGQMVTIPESDVFDWILKRPHGDDEGGYTHEVVMRQSQGSG